jgi:hypothetical protein
VRNLAASVGKESPWTKRSLCILLYATISILKEFCYGVSGVTERYLRFSLILIIDFYYVINKLIILVPTYTNLVLVHNLKYLSIRASLFLTI